jgi:AcrR family transcriptional regulator
LAGVLQADRIVKEERVPKVVDHEQRRSEIVAAVWRIAGDRGLEAVSLGEVAAAAGVSKGLVQHYFRSRDEMLLYAAGELRTAMQRRVAARLDGTPPTLRSILAALLPSDADSRTDALVANAFLIRARNDAAIALRFRQGQAQLRGVIAGLLPDTDDPEREAETLLALVAGLSDGILLGYHTVKRARFLLDAQLDRMGRRPDR